MRAAAFTALALAGCGALGPLEIPLSTTGTVPGALGSIPGAALSTGGFGSTVSQRLQNQGLTAAQLASARLASGQVLVLEPEGGTLSFAKKLEVWISAEGLDRRRIASVADFSAPSPVPFAFDGVDLAPYLVQTSTRFDLVLERHAGQPQRDHSLQLDLVLALTLR
jgi:hypothetical protein